MAMERTHNDPITFEIVDHLTVISRKPDGWTKELNLVSWNGQQPPKFDIREWSPDHTKMSKGITMFDAEMRKMSRAYTRFCNARVVSEGINNRNAAAEAGMRAGKEAARQQEEAEAEARAQASLNAEAMTAHEQEHQDTADTADDFDGPGLADTEKAEMSFQQNDSAEISSEAPGRFASLDEEGAVPFRDGQTASQTGEAAGA